MQIIIVGCGNVGATLVEHLSKEGHNITVIDKYPERLRAVANQYDIMDIVGDGASFTVQNEAGVREADLLIAVTPSDELNLLCCLIAKKAGNCQTIARVRNPVYNREIAFIKEELGLSMTINPEYATALEISRLLKFPSAIKVDPFAKGKAELLKCKVEPNSPLCNIPLIDISTKLHCDVLVCTVERNDEVFIPNGDFVLQERDVISLVAAPNKANEFFKKIGMATNRIRNIMIVGGGKTVYYLTEYLLNVGMNVTIIERDKKRCNELNDLLPEALIINGDGTDKNILQEEGIDQMDAFIAWTDIDEENVMLSLFAKHLSNTKTITKVHRRSYDDIISSLDLDSVFSSRTITSEHITRYVRAMQNSIGSNVKTLYHLIEGKVEALEFSVNELSSVIGIPLKNLDLKKDLLICCINRKGKIITPCGDDTIEFGDTVVVVTTNTGFHDLKDILK